MEAAEIDATPAALSVRLGNLMQMAQQDRKDELLTGLQNLYISLTSAAQFYAPDELSFGVLIHDVDGVAVTDLSPEGLRPLLDGLCVPVGTANQIVETVKKNSSSAGSATSLGLLTNPVR